jgi:uncharacterized protein YqeY
MTLFEQIKEDIKTAMKSGDRSRTDTLRLIMSDIKREAVDSGSDREAIPNEVSLKVIDKASKNRKESIKVYTESNRLDLAEPEKVELEIIQAYLPAQISDEELKSIVEKAKSENPAVQGMALMGRIMPLVKGKADAERIKGLL